MKANPKKRIERGTRGTRHDPPTNAVKPGQVLNPFGAPRKGQSIAETIRTLAAATPREIRELLKRLGGSGNSGMELSLKALPQDTPLRFLQHASAFVASICDPNAPVLGYLRDSDEGKPTEKSEVSGPNGGPIENKVSVVELVDSPKDKLISEGEG